MKTPELKSAVRDFWDAQSCGEVYAKTDRDDLAYYESHRQERYRLEPYIAQFADFASAAGKDVLEIGVGMGADHMEFARANPRSLTGVDLTPRAISHTRRRLGLHGLSSALDVADAEALPFPDESFDLVYSFGVLHHSPDTARAFSEVFRVLRPGGAARIMIYHKQSLAGYMLWTRYALLRGRPWRPLSEIYAAHLESPGTKAYSIEETRHMLSGFSRVNTRVQLSFGELLEGAAGQRHGGIILSVARALWPRSILKRVMRNRGLLLLIDAVK